MSFILTLFVDETQKLLKELANRKQLQVPNIYHHMPHLLNNEGSLHPAVQVGLGRTGGKSLLHPWLMHLFGRFLFADLLLTTRSNSPEMFMTLGTQSGLNKFSGGDTLTTSIPPGLSFAIISSCGTFACEDNYGARVLSSIPPSSFIYFIEHLHLLPLFVYISHCYLKSLCVLNFLNFILDFYKASFCSIFKLKCAAPCTVLLHASCCFSYVCFICSQYGFFMMPNVPSCRYFVWASTANFNSLLSNMVKPSIVLSVFISWSTGLRHERNGSCSVNWSIHWLKLQCLKDQIEPMFNHLNLHGQLCWWPLTPGTDKYVLCYFFLFNSLFQCNVLAGNVNF